MVAASEIISKPKSRRRFLRSGLRGFRAEITDQRSRITVHYENTEVGREKLEASGVAAIPCSSNSYLLTSNSSLLYDYKRLLCETDTVGGAISQTYASDTTEEFGDLIGEDGLYIHQYDAQANTNALLDDTGTVQAQYKYFAFGQVSAVSIDGGPWTAEDWQSLPLDFTSNMLAGGKKQYYLDQEIALYLLGSGNNGRYYDATTGRFLSEDPTRESGGDDNLYRYTGNDPVNNLDPSGHKHKPYMPPQTPQAQQHNQKPSAVNPKSDVPATTDKNDVHAASENPPKDTSAGTKNAPAHGTGHGAQSSHGQNQGQRAQAELDKRAADALRSGNPVLAFKKDPALAAEILRHLEAEMSANGISYLKLHADREIMYALNQASRGRGLDLAQLKFFLGIIREQEHGQSDHPFNVMVTPRDIGQILKWYADSQKGFIGKINAFMDKPGVTDIISGLLVLGGGTTGVGDDEFGILGPKTDENPEATNSAKPGTAKSGVKPGVTTMAAESTRSIRSVQDVLKNPSLLEGKTPAEVEKIIGKTPEWRVEKLGRGGHEGEGWVLREYTTEGRPTGRMLRWHPGGGRHGAEPYWRVTSPERGKSAIIRGGRP